MRGEKRKESRSGGTNAARTQKGEVGEKKEETTEHRRTALDPGPNTPEVGQTKTSAGKSGGGEAGK